MSYLEIAKFIGNESRRVVTYQGVRWVGKNGALLFSGYIVSVWDEENILDKDTGEGDVCTTT